MNKKNLLILLAIPSVFLILFISGCPDTTDTGSGGNIDIHISVFGECINDPDQAPWPVPDVTVNKGQINGVDFDPSTSTTNTEGMTSWGLTEVAEVKGISLVLDDTDAVVSPVSLDLTPSYDEWLSADSDIDTFRATDSFTVKKECGTGGWGPPAE